MIGDGFAEVFDRIEMPAAADVFAKHVAQDFQVLDVNSFVGGVQISREFDEGILETLDVIGEGLIEGVFEGSAVVGESKKLDQAFAEFVFAMLVGGIG